MRRRGKIIATLSTLFLSLVMLVFGVYAAASVSFTIGGTVAYELKDVLVDVNTNFYYSTDNTVLQGDAINTKATAVAGEALPTDLSSVEGFTARSLSTYKNGQVVELTEEEKTISGLQVNFGRYDAQSENKKSYSYYLVMEVTNHGENPVAVSIVDNTTAENVEKLSTTAINFVNNNENIGKNETKKVVVAFNITDLTQSVDNTDFNFVVTIEESNTTPDVSDAFAKVTTNHYTTATKYDVASVFTSNTKLLEEKTLDELEGDISGLTRIVEEKTQIDAQKNATAEFITELELDYSDANAHYLIINVENLSNQPVYVKVTQNHEVTNTFTYRTFDLTSLAGESSGNIVIGCALRDSEREMDTTSVSFKVEIGLSEDYNPVKIDTANEYYYVEMGDFYGMPIRWRMIGTNSETDANIQSGKTNLSHYSTFDANTLPTNTTGVFIQETNTGHLYKYYWNEETDEPSFDNSSPDFYTEREDGYEWGLGLSCVSFNRFKNENEQLEFYKIKDDGTSEYYLDDNDQKIYANNYYTSLARDYINGTDVYKRTNLENSSILSDTTEAKSNMLTDFNIAENDYIYSKITARALTDMTTSQGDFTYDTYIWSASETPVSIPEIEGLTSQKDKMWLLSVEEALTLIGGLDVDTSWDSEIYDKMVWGYDNSTGEIYDSEASPYWLRSALSSSSRIEWIVSDFGECTHAHVFDDYVAPRAAFQLTI